MEQNNKQDLKEALEEYFSRGVDEKRFVDVSRIPLICQDISNIHESLADIKDNITWIVRLVIGAVLLALLAMVFK